MRWYRLMSGWVAMLMVLFFGCGQESILNGADPAPGEGEQVVGFGSGAPMNGLTAQVKERMKKLSMQNLLGMNEGRYTLQKADGVGGHWGLDAIKARSEVGPRPEEKLRNADGTLQTERLVFADTGTGATMMMLTRLPYAAGGPGDQLNYFGKACWSADGRYMLWVRDAKAGLWGPNYQRTTETFGPMRVNADGTGCRIVFSDVTAMKPPICSPTDPNAAYAWSGGKIIELDLEAGKRRKDLGPFEHSWHVKMSPDGEYVISKIAEGFRVLGTADGKVWDVKLDEREPGKCYSIHDSYRFLPANTDWIMYWYERGHPGGGLNKEGFHLRNFKTNQDKIVPFRFDWNHGDVGRFLGFHVSPYVTKWDGKKFTFDPKVGLAWPQKTWTDAGPWYSIPVSVGGYAAHWPDDQLWAYCCVYVHDEKGKQFLSEVSKIFAKPLEEGGRVDRFRVCYDNLWGRQDRWGNKSVSLMRPNMSPDGTKLLFNSNVFNPDGVYMVVCALPMAPTDVAARPGAGGVEVSWKAPKYHAEVAGYNVYRSSESGRGFRLITAEPVTATSYVDPDATGGFYVVRSVERSGLESPLSAEAAAGPTAGKSLAVFCEAEDAISADLDAPSPNSLWMNFDGAASNLHFIWQRRPDRTGSISINVNVPRAGEYYVIARMKGEEGAKFIIAKQDVAVGATADWKWVASATARDLAAGKQDLVIECSKYGSCLDCFYLAEDKDFKPESRIITAKPEALALSAEADGDQVRLKWTGKKSARWAYYNLYVSDRADFTPSQAMLLASPDRETYLDWQLKPGEQVFYKVTQVTRDGLESAPSDPATVAR